MSAQVRDGASPVALIERLERATNDHDLNALVDCFSVDYLNQTPVHPQRGFTGQDQVRKNWRQIFAAVPDLRAVLLRTAVSGDEVWSEWEMAGTRSDGTAHLMRGVIVFGVAGGRARWARFYLEPVQDGSGDVNAAIRGQVGGAR